MMLKNKKTLLIIIILLLTAIGVPLTVQQLQKRQEIRQRAAGAPVSFLLSPPSGNKAIGEEFDIQLSLKVADNDVTGFDFKLRFDTAFLEILNFQPTSVIGVAFTTPLAQANQTGILRYITNNSSTTPIVVDQATYTVALGTLRLKAKAQGTATANFQDVKVTAQGRGGTPLPTENHTVLSYVIGQITPTTGQPTTTPGTPASTTTPQPTAPTATITPSPPAATPTPIPPTPTPCAGCVTFNVTVKLAGIGSDGNPTPNKSPRQAELKVLDATEREVAVGSGPLSYERNSGTFKGPISLTALPAGTYEFKVKAEGYVRRPVPGFQAVAAGATTITLPLTTLSSIDTTNDNELNIGEYNAYVSCFGAKANTTSCPNPSIADFNDDGKLDNGDDFSDYKLLFQSFATRAGD